MQWWDKLRFKAENQKRKAKAQHLHIWSGVSLLIFNNDIADHPIRIRLNIITILLTFILIITIPLISLANIASERFQHGDEIKNIQSRMLMSMHIKANLDQKRQSFIRIQEQLNDYHNYSLQYNHNTIKRLFLKHSLDTYKPVSNAPIGQKYYNLTKFKHLHNKAKYLFGLSAYHSLHTVWHRLTLYNAMPRGRPLPAGSGMITSAFGRRINPTAGVGYEYHSGMDFGDAAGTPLIATASGYIFRAVENPIKGYGNHVRIHHGFGITSLYAHCQSLAVTQGQYVKKGQVVGYLGKTGRVTGNHIHYEVAYGNEHAVDPLEYIQMH